MGVSTASSFKAKSSTQITLPSGETVLCKRGGVEVFLRSGKVPNSLMPLMKSVLTGKKVEDSAKEIEVDDKTIIEMFELFDMICVGVMVSPRCHFVPKSEDGTEGERKDDLLYVDEIELEDKQFLFQWAVGGTADVEKFREQSSQYLSSLQSGEEVQSAPLPPPPAAG